MGHWQHYSVYVAFTNKTVYVGFIEDWRRPTTELSRRQSTLSSMSDFVRSSLSWGRDDDHTIMKRSLLATCVTSWSTWQPLAHPRALQPALDIRMVGVLALYGWTGPYFTLLEYYLGLLHHVWMHLLDLLKTIAVCWLADTLLEYLETHIQYTTLIIHPHYTHKYGLHCHWCCPGIQPKHLNNPNPSLTLFWSAVLNFEVCAFAGFVPVIALPLAGLRQTHRWESVSRVIHHREFVAICHPCHNYSPFTMAQDWHSVYWDYVLWCLVALNAKSRRRVINRGLWWRRKCCQLGAVYYDWSRYWLTLACPWMKPYELAVTISCVCGLVIYSSGTLLLLGPTKNSFITSAAVGNKLWCYNQGCSRKFLFAIMLLPPFCFPFPFPPLSGVPRRQSHRRSGLATLPSVGAVL